MGEADVLSAWRNGARTLAIAPGAVVTVLAREAAARLGVALQVGPLEEPARAATDGATAARRLLYRRHPGWSAPQPLRGMTPIRFRRVAIVGAGGVGTNAAHLASSSGIADEINLIDLVPGLAESVALDLMHASGITNSTSRVKGGTGMELVAGADVVVITAGRPRSPGMSRKDLVEVNGRVVRIISEQIAAHAPEAIVLVVTNPLDEMTEAALVATGFPRQRVLGMAGTLDSSRFRYHLAEAAGVEPADVSAFTLGSHGEEMVPITSQATIAGKPVADRSRQGGHRPRGQGHDRRRCRGRFAAANRFCDHRPGPRHHSKFSMASAVPGPGPSRSRSDWKASTESTASWLGCRSCSDGRV